MDAFLAENASDEQVTVDHACEAVTKLSASGIEPVGIGIQENCVEDIFPSHAVVSDLEDLPKGFMRQLCRVLSGH